MVNWKGVRVRLSRRVWLQGAASLTLFPALAGHAQPGLAHVEIRVQGMERIQQLPLVLADRLGFFQAEGLNVTMIPVPAEWRTLEQVARLPAVVFAGSFERTLYLNAMGQSHQAFVILSRLPQMVLGTSAIHMPAGQGVVDLIGAQIGVQGAGTVSERVARWVLLRAGLKTTDVQFVELPVPGQAMVALNSGMVDALCYGDPVITQLELAGVLRVLIDMRTQRDTETVFGGPVACVCLSAPSAFIDAHPQVVQALASAIVRSLVWLRTAGPSDLMRHVPETFMHGDRTLFLEMLHRSRETFALDGLMPEVAPMNVIRALDRLRLPIEWHGVQPQNTYTNRFAQRARQQWRA